jgi:hypothetical protein
MPHGVELSADFVYSGEIEHDLPAIYSFPAYRDESYRALTDKLVIPGCSPWLYLPRPAVRNRDTILLMPAHSLANIEAEMDDSQFARTVQQRFAGAQLVCCMYWRDVQLGRHLHYLRHDIPVVTAGHMNDPRFAERLAEHFATAKLLVTNDLGSHVFYAAAHEVPVVVLSEVAADWPTSPELSARYCSLGPSAPVAASIEPLFRQESPDMTLQLPAAQMMLGAERIMSATELRELLEALWRTPRFRSRVVSSWRLRRRVAPARMALRRLLGRG